MGIHPFRKCSWHRIKPQSPSKEDLDITLDPYWIQSESFLGICSSLVEMLSATEGNVLLTLHTTLDSGISSDAYEGLTK